MAERIRLNIKQLLSLSKEYDTKQFYEQNQYDRNVNEIIENIDNKIKSILQNVIDNYLDLDIAFIQIYKVLMFATDGIDGVFPNSSLNHFMSYSQFLIHFLIFGCCLGTKYSKYVVLNEKDVHYKNSEILRYCINEFIPKVTTKHIKYKECNKHRDSMTDCLEKYVNNDVAELIADYVEFKFDEFFMTLSFFFQSYRESQGTTSDDKLDRDFKGLWAWYGFQPQSTYSLPLIWPKLLFSKQFIAINDDYKLQENLEYFANNALIKTLKNNNKSLSASFIKKVGGIGLQKAFTLAFFIYALPIWIFIGWNTMYKYWL